MAVTIREVLTSADRKAFVMLPFSIYRDNPYWVPPIIKDESGIFDPEKNPAYDFCRVKFWIAMKDGRCVGRIVALINEKHIAKTGERYGRINRVEFIDDAEVTDALFATAEAWIKAQGMTAVHGPLGFTSLDTQGLMIEGFDYLPSIASVYHLPYYQQHFDRLGYVKENDWVEFRMTITDAVYNKGKRGAQIVKQRFGVEVHSFKTRKEIMDYSGEIFGVLNDAFRDLPYVVELDGRLMDVYRKKYLGLLNPRFVKLVKKEGEVIGFFIGLPSLSKAMQKAGGRLFPFGFMHLMKALKKPEAIDMLLTGVKHEYQSAGIAVVLIGELQEEMMKMGINTLETTGVFETNQSAIANWKNYDYIQYKRRRCYRKDL
jgi:ribosomal protein S18 acetylase RimI-like enzyme